MTALADNVRSDAASLVPERANGARKTGPAHTVSVAARAAVDGAPGIVDGLGFVYVIQFSTGVIKVGQTRNPTQRAIDHWRTAEKLGLQVVNFWLSPQHRRCATTELTLIHRCRKISSSWVGEEYFHDLEFEEVVSLASRLNFFRGDKPMSEHAKTPIESHDGGMW